MKLKNWKWNEDWNDVTIWPRHNMQIKCYKWAISGVYIDENQIQQMTEWEWILLVVVKATNACLTSSPLSSCFSWSHGRRGCQGPGEEKSRVQWWNDVHRYRWAAETTCRGERLSHSGGCMLTADFRQHAEDQRKTPLWPKKKGTNAWRRHEKERDIYVGGGSLEMARWRDTNLQRANERFHLTTDTRAYAVRKGCAGTKETVYPSIDVFSLYRTILSLSSDDGKYSYGSTEEINRGTGRMYRCRDQDNN